MHAFLLTLLAATHYVGSGPALVDAVAKVGASERAHVILTDTSLTGTGYTIADDLTVPEHVTLQFQPGAYLDVAATKTVTINGPIDALPERIFGGSGSVDVRSALVPQVYAEWWHDPSSSDWAPAIQEAIYSQHIIQLLARTYVIDSQLVGYVDSPYFQWVGAMRGVAAHTAFGSEPTDRARTTIEVNGSLPSSIDAIFSMVHPTTPQGTRTRFESIKFFCNDKADYGLEVLFFTVELSRVMVRNCNTAAVILDDSYYFKAEYSDFSYNGNGIVVGSNANAYWIYDNKFKFNDIGIWVDQAGYNNINVLNNSFIANDLAIVAEAVDGNGLSIDYNYFEDNGRDKLPATERYPIWIKNSGDGVTSIAKNLTIANSTGGGGPHDYWFRVEGCRNCAVMNNKIFNDDGGPMGYFGALARGVFVLNNTAGTGMDRRFVEEAGAQIYGYMENTNYSFHTRDGYFSSGNLIHNGKFVNALSGWSSAVGLATGAITSGALRVTPAGNTWNYISYSLPDLAAYDAKPLWLAVNLVAKQGTQTASVILKFNNCGGSAVRINEELQDGYNFFSASSLDYSAVGGSCGLTTAEIQIVPDGDAGTEWIDVDDIAFGVGIEPTTNPPLTENGGVAEFNGGGTSFVIPHGLPITPKKYSVTPASADAAVLHSVAADATNITVTTTSATAGGTNNVDFAWTAFTKDY